MNDNGTDALPQGWAWATLSDVCQIDAGNPAPQGSEHFDGGVCPFVRVQDLGRLGERVYIHETKDYLTEQASKALKRFPQGAVLFTKSGMSTLLNQRAILGRDMHVVSHIGVAVPQEPIPSRYIYYWLSTVDFGKLAHATTLPSLPLSKVRDIKVPVAPLSEQNRIVDEIEKQFTRLEASVAELERARVNLKRYRAAILQAACGGRLVPTEAELARAGGHEYEPADRLLERILRERRAKWEADQLAKMRAAGKEPRDDGWKARYKEPRPPDTTNVLKLPEGWVWASPAQFSSGDDHSLTIGPFGSNLKVSDYREQGVPLVFVRNIRARVFGGARTSCVSEEKARELGSHWVSPGDILVTKMGDPPGDACLYPYGQPLAVITADCIKLKPNADLSDSQYLVHAINSNVVRPQIVTITKGVAQLKVSLARFKTIAIPLPPLGEQRRIVEEVERRLSVLDELEAAVERGLKRADRLRQAVLKRAFEGKLVPQDPNDELASVLLERIRAERAAQAHASNSRRGRPASRERRMRRTPVPLSEHQTGVDE